MIDITEVENSIVKCLDKKAHQSLQEGPLSKPIESFLRINRKTINYYWPDCSKTIQKLQIFKELSFENADSYLQ